MMSEVPSGLSDEQEALFERDGDLRRLQRGLDRVIGMFPLMDWRVEACRRFEAADPADKFVVLDGACGSGLLCEELMRHLHGEYGGVALNRCVGIGLDTNPIPQHMPPVEGEGALKTRFVEGSVDALPLPDNSVDMYFLVEGLSSVGDVLKALEEAWRVLKPDGIMFSTCHKAFLTNPSIYDIWENTPGANEVLTLMDMPQRGGAYRYTVVGLGKAPGISLKFPYRFVEAKRVDRSGLWAFASRAYYEFTG